MYKKWKYLIRETIITYPWIQQNKCIYYTFWFCFTYGWFTSTTYSYPCFDIPLLNNQLITISWVFVRKLACIWEQNSKYLELVVNYSFNTKVGSSAFSSVVVLLIVVSNLKFSCYIFVAVSLVLFLFWKPGKNCSSFSSFCQ